MSKKDRTIRDYLRPGTEDRGRTRESFNSTDADKDGRITFEEFVRFMADLDPEMSREECRIGFDEIDADDDQAISFEEFEDWWG